MSGYFLRRPVLLGWTAVSAVALMVGIPASTSNARGGGSVLSSSGGSGGGPGPSGGGGSGGGSGGGGGGGGGDNTQPRSLKGIAPPLPDLTGIVTNRATAVALGKALFWDSNAGSDGQACASCHFHSGADARTINQLNPDMRGVVADLTFQPTQTGAGGPNYAVQPGDFPFHKLADPNNRQSTVLFDTNDVMSSAGTFAGSFQSSAPGAESCAAPSTADAASAAFSIAGKGANAGKTLFTRRIEPRNVPTVINAAYNFRNFWDGRANNIFNGSDPFGERDADAAVLVADGAGNLSPQKLALANASLASQAVGPALSDMEMSCANRGFADLGRKLITIKALASQTVSSSDSVLGPLRNAKGPGLSATYLDLIKGAFDAKYWSSTKTLNSYTQVETNFSMFWGVAIMLYEATLVSDDSPFDRYMAANQKAVPGFGDSEKRGLGVFTGKGNCSSCHSGPLLTKAAIVTNGDQVIESRGMADGGQALTDTGFANIGARPTRDDLGLGVVDSIVGQPLSYARQYLANPAGPNPDPFTVTVGGLSDNFGLMTTRVAVDGTFKVPSLRNVAQTPPYFHNGGQGNLQQVIQFYSRGGDRRNVANGDTSGTGKLGEDDPTALAPSGSNVDAKVTNIGLGPQDQADLLAFLKSLTDDRVRCHAAPFDHPSLTISHGADPSAPPNGKGEAAEVEVTLAAVGASGLGAKCAGIANSGDVSQLPSALNAMLK